MGPLGAHKLGALGCILVNVAACCPDEKYSVNTKATVCGSSILNPCFFHSSQFLIFKNIVLVFYIQSERLAKAVHSSAFTSVEVVFETHRHNPSFRQSHG